MMPEPGTTVIWAGLAARPGHGSSPRTGKGEIEVEQRATWILERVDGRWVIVFEHVSFPKDRPYGTETISS